MKRRRFIKSLMAAAAPVAGTFRLVGMEKTTGLKKTTKIGRNRI
ncbi:MAG: hypothetical protein WBI18_03160 [Candidatus Saccharicenans sp.]